MGFATNEIYFLRPQEDADVVRVVIATGDTQADIGALLAEEKLISSQFLFKLYTKWREADTRFQQGVFEIPRGTNMRRIVSLLTLGEYHTEKTITIIEGWTLREIADHLETVGISREEFFVIAGAPPAVNHNQRASQDFSDEFLFLRNKPDHASLEGYLFPDTYRIFENATAADAVRTMLTNFEEKVGDISYDDLILASIVEREVAGDDDRRMVADLFLRRMQEGMALQADSTVNYVTAKKTPALSSEDRALRVSYNTYQYRGLTPGPISNPSLEAIEAVLHPMPNPYVYFLTDKKGAVHYGRTLEEHNANKTQYVW